MTQTPKVEGAKDSPTPLPKWAQVLIAIWIFGGALLFYIRFSSVFYEQNKSAVDGAWNALWETLGLGG